MPVANSEGPSRGIDRVYRGLPPETPHPERLWQNAGSSRIPVSPLGAEASVAGCSSDGPFGGINHLSVVLHGVTCGPWILSSNGYYMMFLLSRPGMLALLLPTRDPACEGRGRQSSCRAGRATAPSLPPNGNPIVYR